MMYDEFTRRLDDLEVPAPTVQQYTEIIEPVYNYHPVFDLNNAKDYAAKLYATGGLGIFDAMRHIAELAKEDEERLTKIRHKYEEAKREFDEENARMKEWREMVRTDWGVGK